MCAPDDSNPVTVTISDNSRHGYDSGSTSSTSSSRSNSSISETDGAVNRLENERFSSPRQKSRSSRRRRRGRSQKKLDGGHSTSSSSSQQHSEHQHSRRMCQSFSQVSYHLFAGALLSLFFVGVTPYLPYLTSPQAGLETFKFASFEYDITLSHFDNTIWTWGTDYALASTMGLLIWGFAPTKFVKREFCSQTSEYGVTTSTHTQITTTTTAHVQTRRSQAMLLCYLLSVLTGGLAHHFYTTAESRNTWSFRALWTICVGTVTLAPAFMGSIATELHHLNRETSSKYNSKSTADLLQSLPVVPTWFWVGYASCSTLIAINGGMSYQRPACDICVAGVTQTPCTFYLIATICYGFRQHDLSSWLRKITPIAFVLNAPLFPMYPLLIQYTDWSLGSVNTLLHAWLMVAWTTQGLILTRVAMALDKYYD